MCRAAQISGGSVYDEGVGKAEATANPEEARRDAAEGTAADGNLGKMQKITAVYDRYVAPFTDPAGILTDEIKNRLTEATGIDFRRFGTVGDARAEIQKMFAGMVVNLRDSQGQPMFKGGLDQIMAHFPTRRPTPSGSAAVSKRCRHRSIGRPRTGWRPSNIRRARRARITSSTRSRSARTRSRKAKPMRAPKFDIKKGTSPDPANSAGAEEGG